MRVRRFIEVRAYPQASRRPLWQRRKAQRACHTLSHLVVTPCGHTLLSHLVVTPCGHTLLSHLVVTPCCHLVVTPCCHTLLDCRRSFRRSFACGRSFGRSNVFASTSFASTSFVFASTSFVFLSPCLCRCLSSACLLCVCVCVCV